MSKQKKEVSDKIVVVLLVVAVVVSILGAYVVYDYSQSNVYDGEPVLEDHATGSVILNVVENPDLREVENNEDI
jgi:hypothetical protein